MRYMISFFCLLFLASPALAEWELYDDFNTVQGGVPDISKWDFRENNDNLNVSVENGRMKIVLKTTDPSSMRPGVYHSDTNNIYGIKFDFTVASYTSAGGDNLQPKFRVIKELGAYNHPTFTRTLCQIASLPHNTNPDRHHFYGEYTIENNDYSRWEGMISNWYDLFDDTYLNTTRTMGIVVSEKGQRVFLNDRISTIYYDQDITPNGWPFNIVIRPKTDGDEMTVYVDNVYVYRGEPTDIGSVCPGTFGKTVVVPLF